MTSGWCSDPEGRCTSPKAHAVCQMRLDDHLLPRCDCTRDGGHTHTDKEESAD